MTKQVLDVHQMQHLQELGLELDYDTLYRYVKFEDSDWILKPFSDLNIIGISFKYIPAYTLQDVLDALPKEIKIDGRRYWPIIDMAEEWMGFYHEYFGEPSHIATFFFRDGVGLIDAVYEMLCWSIENKHIKTNKKTV